MGRPTWHMTSEMRQGPLPLVLAAVIFSPLSAAAQVGEDLNRVIDQGLSHSQVMQLAEQLMDGIGARMTNSPQMRQAEVWTQAQFKGWGLKNVRKEGFSFGRGWSMVSSSVRMMT